MTNRASPLDLVRKESRPPWPPASPALITLAHAYGTQWYELWQYKDEGRTFLEGQVESVCGQITHLRRIAGREEISIGQKPINSEATMARAQLNKCYKEAMLLQKRLRGWTAHCRSYKSRLIKERRGLIDLIKKEGHTLESIGLDRWRYWYLGGFSGLGREEKVFHLPLEDFIKCEGRWGQHSDRPEEDFDDEDMDLDSCGSDGEYLDDGLVKLRNHQDGVRWDEENEVYYLHG